MVTPFTKYIEAKDNYCLTYFGNDKYIMEKILHAREIIENELKGINIYVACDFSIDAKNIILKSEMKNFVGKMAWFYNLNTKEDILSLLMDSKINIPENFLN